MLSIFRYDIGTLLVKNDRYLSSNRIVDEKLCIGQTLEAKIAARRHHSCNNFEAADRTQPDLPDRAPKAPLLRGMMRLQHGMMMAAPQSGPLGLTRPPPGIFCKSYQCHSMACLDRKGLEFGDKIILPQAAFQEASAQLLFELEERRDRANYCIYLK